MSDPKNLEHIVQTRIPLKYRLFISTVKIKKVIDLCAAFIHLNKAFELTIVYTNNQEIQKLNQVFRDIDAPTDVLSFSMNVNNPETRKNYLGDIIISVQKAKQQSLQFKQSLDDELTLLLIHGFLHLNGFDHDTPNKKQKMWKLQDRILTEMVSGDKKLREK